MSITLYYAAGACSLAALTGLEEAGARFEAVRLVLAEGDQRSAAYRAIHPRGRVPVLVLDGQAIGENLAVLTVIARLFPQAKLLPDGDAAAVGRAYELLAWFASGVHVSFAQVGRPERYTRDESVWPALAAGGRENMLAAYAEIEERLADGREWLLGDFSLADPYAYSLFRWSGRLEADMAQFPAFSAHAARVLARPSVQRALAWEAEGPTLLAKQPATVG